MSILNISIRHAWIAGTDRSVTADAMKSFFETGNTGTGTTDGGIKPMRFDRGLLYHTGQAPSVTRAPGVITITVATQSQLVSVNVLAYQAEDANGSNSGYDVRIVFPAGTAQTLPYDGSLEQCPKPARSMDSLDADAVTSDFAVTTVTPNPNGITVSFPEAFGVPGAKRSLNIVF